MGSMGDEVMTPYLLIDLQTITQERGAFTH